MWIIDFLRILLLIFGVTLHVPVFVLDETLRSIWTVLGDLRILSEPYEKPWHSQDKNVSL